MGRNQADISAMVTVKSLKYVSTGSENLTASTSMAAGRENRPDLGGSYLLCIECKASTAPSDSCFSPPPHALTDFRH